MVSVFIAEDSVEVRDRLCEMIDEIKGVEIVGQAGDTKTALEGIQHLQPEVIILDIRMPGGNGIQVLEAVRETNFSPIVIMLTAFPTPQYREKCIASGADLFFDKSNEFERVCEVIADIQEESVSRIVLS